ncbi:MAG: peptidylprolyl isomerase [Verrucomicrobiota bacterium]|nr:peptidylprolyl isomerase [Verrucomicrobiota bacterium]
MRAIFSALLLVALALGCDRKPEPLHTMSRPPAPQLAAGPGPIVEIPNALQATDVLVDVDGAKLTCAQADIEVGYRMNAMRTLPPPERAAWAKEQTLRHVLDQYVARFLLLRETERQNIIITPEEEEAGYNTVRAQLPPGKTLEDVLTNSPLGEAGMRAEFLTGLKINKLLGAIMTNEPPVPDEQLNQLCDNTRRARHILVKIDPTDMPQVKDEKKKKIEDLRRQLVEGADFAALARGHSDCQSRQEGGDLGLFPRGRMDPIFEKAAFSQKDNEIGAVVETRFGCHIIQVLPLDREKLHKLLAQELKSKQIASLVARLKAKAQIKYHPAVVPKPSGAPMNIPLPVPAASPIAPSDAP